MRIACLHVPLFPAAARLRSEPDLRGEAVAVFAGSGHAARIAAVTRRARKAGIRRGMTLPQARALMPRLLVRARDGECERAAQESLVEVAESFSPRVEDAGEGVVYLDLTGVPLPPTRTPAGRRLASGRAGERALAEALSLAAGEVGLTAWVGIASSKLAARVAAEDPRSPTLVAAGKEAGFLAPLPLARLAPEAEVFETLRRWGIHSIGDFARLPQNQVASRLGAAGQRLHEKARGLDRRPIIPHRPPATFHEGIDLDWPLVAIEPFLFVARAALDRLCRRLERRGLACARLEVALRLDPHGYDERSIAFPSPTREPKTLLTLIKLDLERRTPGAPVTGFTLVAHPDRPRQAQLSLFGPTALSPDRLATTLARLFALLGPDSVGSPRPVDGHRPERCALTDYAPPPPPETRPEPRPGRGLLAVRVLRPPVRLEVLTATDGGRRLPHPPADEVAEAGAGTKPATVGNDRPLELRPAIEEAGDNKLRIAGEVRVASGPWAVEEGWWTREAVERSYWDVELAGGGIYRIYEDRKSGEWYADGVYD